MRLSYSVSSRFDHRVKAHGRRSDRVTANRRVHLVLRSANKNDKQQLGDDLLDFIQAGRKLRRWYGEGERPVRGDDDGDRPEGSSQGDEDPDEDDAGGYVMVTDAEGPVGEQVVLQLILSRLRVKVVVRDVMAARSAYGPYVTPVSLDMGSPSELKRALKGVETIVVVGKLGALAKVVPSVALSHICLLSTAGSGSDGGLFGMFKSAEDSVLSDISREAAVSTSGVPFSIVRSGQIRLSPGGRSGILLTQGSPTPLSASSSAPKPMSCEDLASVLVEALKSPPAAGRYFSVVNAPSSLPAEGDWQQALRQLSEVSLA